MRAWPGGDWPPPGLVDWPTIVLQCFDTVCWVIWPVKVVPNMTYNVFGGTLNPTLLLLLGLVGRLSGWKPKCQSWPTVISTASSETCRISHASFPSLASGSKKPRTSSGWERWRITCCDEPCTTDLLNWLFLLVLCLWLCLMETLLCLHSRKVVTCHFIGMFLFYCLTEHQIIIVEYGLIMPFYVQEPY